MEELLLSIKTLELDQLCELLRELSTEISSRIEGSRIHKLETDQVHDKIFCIQYGMSCAELEDLFGDYGQCLAEHIDGSNRYCISFVNKDDYLRAINNMEHIKKGYNKG